MTSMNASMAIVQSYPIRYLRVSTVFHTLSKKRSTAVAAIKLAFVFYTSKRTPQITDATMVTADETVGNEEDLVSTGQFRALVPTAQVPLHGRKEEATKGTDKETESAYLGDIEGLLLRRGKDTPE
ncbi:unnamed protein product [Penicillium glandicola]